MILSILFMLLSSHLLNPLSMRQIFQRCLSNINSTWTVIIRQVSWIDCLILRLLFWVCTRVEARYLLLKLLLPYFIVHVAICFLLASEYGLIFWQWWNVTILAVPSVRPILQNELLQELTFGVLSDLLALLQRPVSLMLEHVYWFC